MPHTSLKPGSVFLLSLGCPKNRVDSERMLGCLLEADFSIAESAEEADLLIVNTCGFIEPAKEESIEAILSLAEIKSRREGRKLIVTGCLSQRYGPALAEEMPEIDVLLGTEAFPHVARAALEPPSGGNLPLILTARDEQQQSHACAPRVRTTRGGCAYLKISEGCDNSCAFCVIPHIRGPQRSVPVADLVGEAARLVDGGVKELNLIAQDLSSYGRDLPDRPGLEDLLERLVEIEDLRWIRMLYAYPKRAPDRLLDVWAGSEKILPYLDIPLQHASSRMLRLMKRGSDVDLIKSELARMRERVGGPKGGLTLRTTFLVGHPGETEDDFEELLRFVEEMRFEKLGVFTYSDEEGSASFEMGEKVDPQLAEERKGQLMELQRGISADHQQSLVGRKLEVLVEGSSEESELVIQGRHGGQAPEIDGLVYIEEADVGPGRMVEVEIHSAYDYDLVGRVVPADRRGQAR
ncbi:MAG: 30S ribosomal protein S12 methylthiotransferase RimO [Myxococcota bacterium]